MEIIYCRGSDKDAPRLAQAAGMKYGLRYNHTAYSKEIYMLDAGLSPKWGRYLKRAKLLRPVFALTPDYVRPDLTELDLRIVDIRQYAQIIGVCPKFVGATAQIPNDCIICESIPSKYAGWLIPDNELLPERDYHLLGGDPKLQKTEIGRIRNAGGRIASIDGNKLMLKAVYGQVFANGKWLTHSGRTEILAEISANEIKSYLQA